MKRSSRFDLEDLVRLPTFVYPTVSWAGDQVACYWDRSGRMELWTVDIRTGRQEQITQGQLPRSLHAGFTWDRTGTAIVFPKDRDGNEQHDLWLLDRSSGDAILLTDRADAQEIPLEFSPDDRRISFLSTRNGQLNLFSMERNGSDVRELTTFANPVMAGGQWSPDGSYLTAAANETDDLRNIDIYLIDASGGGARRIFSRGTGTADYPGDWFPDGTAIAITSDASGVNRAGILGVRTGEVEWLGRDGVDESAAAVSPDGRLVLAIRNQDARLKAVVYHRDTGAERLPSLPADASVSRAGFALGGSALVLAYSTDATRSELVLYDLESEETKSLICPEYGSIDPSAFVTAEDVYYPSFDGLHIHGLLYRPHDIPEGERVPAIVLPHGGPTGQYFHGFDPYTQFLVNEGYAVLLPNIRGSTGYGVEFRDAAIKDWGGADLQDIVAGRMVLASLPFADERRIGIFGISYGGYMTYIATTTAPEHWKAGVAAVGITDLSALYRESMPHFKYYLRQQMGDPEHDLDLWRDRSAINFPDRMQAKLLITHGVNDPRCPISQARLFRDRLLELGRVEGRDFEYEEFGAEGHGSTDQDQRLRTFKVVADFFARSL